MDAVIHEDNNNNMDNMDDDHQRDNSDANNNTDTADDDDITDLIYILQHRRDFPVQQRERTILDLARNFHTELIDDTHTRITDQTSGDEILGALVLFFLKPRENRRLTRRNSNTQHAPHCSNSNSTMDAVSHVDNDTDRNNNADTTDDDDSSVVDTDENDIIKDVIHILQHWREFPVEERERTILELARDFHEMLYIDIHTMITDQTYGETYSGLDSQRDTEAEVEMALQCYPYALLSTRKTEIWDMDFVPDDYEDGEARYGGWNDVDDNTVGDYPINCLTYVRDETGKIFPNKKAMPFIHLFARLAIQWECFPEKERGGLFIPIDRDMTDWTFQNAVRNLFSYTDQEDENDTIVTTQLIRLRQSEILTKEDVLQQYLHHGRELDDYFPLRRFRFFIEWNPELLLHNDYHSEQSPLDYAAGQSLEAFQVVCDYYIRYYPHFTGINLLFQTDGWGSSTAFQRAVENFGRKNVVDVVEEILGRYSVTTPIQTMHALMVAATDTNTGIHLGCVYFLIRREPNVVVRTLLRYASKDDADSPPLRNADDLNNRIIINNNSSSKIDENDTHNCSHITTIDARNGIGEDGDGTRNQDPRSKIVKRKRKNH